MRSANITSSTKQLDWFSANQRRHTCRGNQRVDTWCSRTTTTTHSHSNQTFCFFSSSWQIPNGAFAEFKLQTFQSEVRKNYHHTTAAYCTTLSMCEMRTPLRNCNPGNFLVVSQLEDQLRNYQEIQYLKAIFLPTLVNDFDFASILWTSILRFVITAKKKTYKYFLVSSWINHFFL